MGGIKKISSIFFNKKAYKKMIAYALLFFMLYVFRDFLGVFLLTFVFAYFFNNIAVFIKDKLIILGKKIKFLKFIGKIPFWIIILFEYLTFVGIIVLLVANIVPNIQKEVSSLSKATGISVEQSIENKENILNEGKNEDLDNDLLNEIENAGSVATIDDVITGDGFDSFIITTDGNIIKENEKRIKTGFEKIKIKYDEEKNNIINFFKEKDPNNTLHIAENIKSFEDKLTSKEFWSEIGNTLKSIGGGIGKVILALILSFIFIVDRKKTEKYLYRIKESNFSFIYTEYQLLIDKVLKSFGLILKAQSIIAFANSVLTILGLIIIGFIFSNVGGINIPMFPYLLTLWLVVFVFGFIPVLGVFISSVPILLIGYTTYNSITIVFAILALIMIVHMIEAYYLNPKIISKFLELPVSLTFVILIISEHLFGLAGLLIGISLFYFIVGLLKDFNKMLEEKKKKKLKSFFTKKEKVLE